MHSKLFHKHKLAFVVVNNFKIILSFLLSVSSVLYNKNCGPKIHTHSDLHFKRYSYSIIQLVSICPQLVYTKNEDRLMFLWQVGFY